MSDNNRWEVVGGKAGGKAKGKPANKNTGNGTSKGSSGVHIPVIKVDELVTPLDTKYAMLDPQLRAQAKREALGLPAAQTQKEQKAKAKQAAAASTKEVVKKKPSPKESTKQAPKSLPEALKQLNVTELNTAMTTVKARFSGSSLLWIKELASYLNSNMNVETDPVFSGKPRDYPTNLLSSDIKSIITSIIQSCEEEVLHSYLEQSLITIPSDMNRGVAVCGTKIVLQLMLLHKPHLILAHLGRAREILENNESRVPVTLSILWVLSQPAFKDARIGVQVWTETMLPLIRLKNYGAYIAQVAEYLTTKMPNTKLSTSTISVADYYKFVEQLQQASIPTNVRREVTNFIHALAQPMTVAHGAKMFSPSLKRLVSNDPSERAEISRNLVNCLRTDAHSYEIWRKEYRSNLVASSHLLKWIIDNETTKLQKSQEFQETLLHFQSVNNAFSPTDKLPQGLKSCIHLCSSMMGKSQPIKRSGSKLKKINYLLLIALISLVYYDIRVNGDGHFVDSRLGKAAERSGLTAKAFELHQRAQPHLAQAEDHLIQLRDVVYVKAGEVHQRAEPYLTKAGEGLVQLRDAVYRKGEELYPGVWAEADKKYQAALVVAKEQSAILYAKASEYAEQGMDVGAKYWFRFVDWSAVYRKQLAIHTENAIELSGVYYQRARQMTAEWIEKEQVQHALKYTYDMYHKALHAVGLCSH